MATEIEYKFLITDLSKVPDLSPLLYKEIMQGYFTADREVVTRVRLIKFSDNQPDEAWIGVKGPAESISKPEFEYRIPKDDAVDMLRLCGTRIIEKTRYLIPHGDHTIELDYFTWHLFGLVMAEIEVKTKEEKIIVPDWFGENVSSNLQYTNVSLALLPYESKRKLIESIYETSP